MSDTLQFVVTRIGFNSRVSCLSAIHDKLKEALDQVEYPRFSTVRGSGWPALNAQWT